MSWSRFAKILQTRPLDRETKLQLIDLLAGVDDPKLEEEIFTFVFAWEEAEAQTQKALIDGVALINTQYEEARKNLNLTTQKNMLSLADDLARQKRIDDLRAQINTL